MRLLPDSHACMEPCAGKASEYAIHDRSLNDHSSTGITLIAQSAIAPYRRNQEFPPI